MKRKIIILVRVPFIDKIPSLKALIVYFAKHGVQVTIISSYNERYPTFDFQSNNINVELVKERNSKYGLPTSLKMLLKCVKKYITNRPNAIIGGDDKACQLLCWLSEILPIRYINFLLEYPDINNPEEAKSLMAASYIITHDKWHGDFLFKHYHINTSKILYLPNASYTPQYYKRTDFLKKMLNIPLKKNVILHSGGLGVWFLCKELAYSTQGWKEDDVLVFHTSHHVEDTTYYKEMVANLPNKGKVFFSTRPVSNETLDELVASASIGIALYSVEILGYRATYMGLAAGKIGNYLKCGVPVIATRVPSLTYLEEYQCGMLIDELSEIPKALQTIHKNYAKYSENAHKCYSCLWEPSKYLERIYEELFQS